MTAPLATPEEVARLSTAELIEQAWRAGELEYLLRPYQKPLYREMREALWGPGGYKNPNGKHRRGMGEVHRRYGKSHGLAGVPAVELCIQVPGARVYWAAETEKQVKRFLRPIMHRILRDCPDDMRPTWHIVEGELRFPNGSLILFSGCEDEGKCDRLRGDACDLFIVDEAGSIDLLEYLYKSVVLWMLSTTNGRALFISTPARKPGHPFTKYCVQAEAGTGWHAHRDVHASNFTPEQLAELAVECGGVDTPAWRREALALREIDKETAVVPEFDRKRHVVARSPMPAYAICYVALDPGTRDMLAILWALWDTARQKLVVICSWAKRNAGTSDVAWVMREVEKQLWSHTTYYDREEQVIKPNPFMRISDIDARLIYDLSNEHGLHVAPTRKDEADAQVYALRNAIQGDLIELMDEPRGAGPIQPPEGMSPAQAMRWRDEIAPYFGVVAMHVENARYNRTRTDWDRTEELGHYDALAALIYLWRLVSGLRNLNPQPPESRGSNYFEPPRKHEPTVGEALMPSWRRKR
jgi:hypothetical protein